MNEQRRIRMIVDRVPDDAGSILDVGCVRHDSRRRQRGNLHDRLHTKFPKADIVGVDLPGQETTTMRRDGYDVRGVDCQDMDLGETFDAVVAGELIEHLPNPGLFLQSVAQHLNDGAPLVLSTPNPNCGFYQAMAVLGRWTSNEHTCWISPYQLQTLCEYSGAPVTVESVEWVPYPRLSRVASLHNRVTAPHYVAVVR